MKKHIQQELGAPHMCIFNVLLKPIPWTRNDHNLTSLNKSTKYVLWQMLMCPRSISVCLQRSVPYDYLESSSVCGACVGVQCSGKQLCRLRMELKQFCVHTRQFCGPEASSVCQEISSERPEICSRRTLLSVGLP